MAWIAGWSNMLRPRGCVLLALFTLLINHAHGSQTLYITPEGAGTRAGADWANAGTLDQLSSFIQAAGPGGTVLLRADLGPYRPASQIPIRAGGNDDNVVTIAGSSATGDPLNADIVGTRAEPYDAAGAQGTEVFRLLSGANNLEFRHISFRNIGNGAFRIGSDISGLTIRHVTATNLTRFIENTVSGEALSATITNLTVRDVTVKGFSKGVARLRYDSNSILFEDVHGDSEQQDGGDFAMGILLDDTAHNATFRRVIMENAYDSLNNYWNGDGFATERGTYAILFEDTVASGNTDAGYDLKSSDTLLLRPTAQDNKRNYRIHGNVEVKNCTGISPHKRGGTGSQTQVWVGGRGTAVFSECMFSDDDPATIVFQVEQSSTLTVSDVAVSKNPNAHLSFVEPDSQLHGCCGD